MRLRIAVIVLTFFTVSISTTAQSVYQLQYDFHLTNDSIAYHAFLVRFDDGSGLLRIRYLAPGTNEDVVIETDIEEDYRVDQSGATDTNTLVLKSANPRYITGSDKTGFSTPIFIFKNNVASGYFEPGGVVRTLQESNPSPNTSFTGGLIESSMLTKDVVLQFFSEDEDFVVNLFNTGHKGLSPVEKSTKFYLLVVADTLDKEIGSACAKDMRRAVETFSALTSYLAIKFIPQTISGQQYNKENVQKAINNLKPSSNDIVVFYYTGHGFRTPENSRRFPNLKLKNFRNDRKNFPDSISWIKKDRQDNITYSLNIEDIFSSIKKKGARFNLVMSDCCNNDIFSTNAIGTKPGKTKASGIDWSEDNIRVLFLNKAPMSVLVTAASTGQKATSNNDFGGFFSYFFKTSMEKYSSKLQTGPSWDLIMQDAQKQTIFKARHTYCDKPYIPANICEQNPDYKIVFGK
jgi:hypothetical protein